MVSDAAFNTVLIIAIVLFVLLVAFVLFVKSKLPSPMMMRILSTLHAALFGYEKALVEFIGARGYRTHVYPEINTVIKTLKEESDQIMEIFGAETPCVAMEQWMTAIENEKIITGGYIEDKGNDEYVIHIPECSMSNPLHEIIGDRKGICPMALIISSASSIVSPDKEPDLSYSEFTPTGTITKMKLKPKLE